MALIGRSQIYWLHSFITERGVFMTSDWITPKALGHVRIGLIRLARSPCLACLRESWNCM